MIRGEYSGREASDYFSASRKLDGASDLVSQSVWLKAKSRVLGGALVIDGWARHDRSLKPRGDSGAVVTDMNGTPLGMIIGGNGVFSYAVKFTNMFNANKLYSEYSFLI